MESKILQPQPVIEEPYTFIKIEFPYELLIFLVDDCLLNPRNLPKIVDLLRRLPEDTISKMKASIVNKTEYVRINNMFNSSEWKIQRENHLLREENKKMWLEIHRLKGTDIPDSPPKEAEELNDKTPLLRSRISKIFS